MMLRVHSVIMSSLFDLWKESSVCCLHGSLQILGCGRLRWCFWLEFTQKLSEA